MHDPFARQFHGHLPPLATIPPTATLSKNQHDQRVAEQGVRPQLIIQPFLPIFQGLYASVPRYESRGERYGYVAFGPIINLASTMLTPVPFYFQSRFRNNAEGSRSQFEGMAGVPQERRSSRN